MFPIFLRSPVIRRSTTGEATRIYQISDSAKRSKEQLPSNPNFGTFFAT